MPIVASSFHPPPWLANGHLQTILPALLPRRFDLPFRRERLELPDGDFLDLDWSGHGARRLVILSHGLEGCSTQIYIRGMGAEMRRAGWDILAWNFRGCGAGPNRLPRSYHSGETEDLRAVIELASARYEKIALIGFSLGGNVTLKFLGEAAPPGSVIVAAAISAPIDLASCALALDTRPGNRIYLRRFLASLIARAEAKARSFPDRVNALGARRIRTIREYDDRFTAPLHGFRDAADYWTRSSSRQFLPRIAVPTLLLNARNDPLLSGAAFPEDEARASEHLFLEAPESGGHVGFLDLRRGWHPWSERRVAEFFASSVPTLPG